MALELVVCFVVSGTVWTKVALVSGASVSKVALVSKLVVVSGAVSSLKLAGQG